MIQKPGATVLGSWIVLGLAIARFAFLPLFLFCNISPENRNLTGVYFFSDWAYLGFMLLFSLSNGYIGSICMIFAPKTLPEGPAQSTGASIMVSFLVLGLAVGSALSMCSVLLL